MDDSRENEQLQELPAFDDIVQRFSLFATSPSCDPQVGTGGSIDCNCEGCSQWHGFVEGHSPYCKEVQYEVFTKEHIEGLASYLLSQAMEYKLPRMKVLEVGAGSGRLSLHLNYYLNQLSASSEECVVHVTASDSGVRGLNGRHVTKQDAAEAMTQARPHVVLVSWMDWVSLLTKAQLKPGHLVMLPMGVDWTAHMRATPSVLEYILIGEMDDGICGDPWRTWGYREPGDSSSDSSFDDASSYSRFNFGSSSTAAVPLDAELQNYGPGRPVVTVESQSACSEYSDKLRYSMERTSGLPVSSYSEGSFVDDGGSKLGSEGADSISPPLIAGLESSLISIVGQNNFDIKIKKVPEESPPYAVDGWERTEIATLSTFQICRTDERWSTRRHSRTVSFRRLLKVE